MNAQHSGSRTRLTLNKQSKQEHSIVVMNNYIAAQN